MRGFGHFIDIVQFESFANRILVAEEALDALFDLAGSAR
jgi:hypothetical protein